MALASLFGGMALANAALGAVHGFAGPLGGMIHAPHGELCARLLPLVMEANIKALESRHAGHVAIERYIEIAQIVTGDKNASAQDGVKWVKPKLGIVDYNGNKENNLTGIDGGEAMRGMINLVLHDPEGFDLDLILKPGADLTPIAHGLSIDTHSYEWQVPDQPCSECQLKVTQFNTINTDYEGFVAISISSTGGSANIGVAGSNAGGSESTGGKSGSAMGGKPHASAGETGSDPGFSAGTTSHSAGGSMSSSGASSDDGGCALTHRGGPNASLSLLMGLLGLGAALVLKSLHAFRDAGLALGRLEVTAENEAAVRLYRRLGFRFRKTLFKVMAPYSLAADTDWWL